MTTLLHIAFSGVHISLRLSFPPNTAIIRKTQLAPEGSMPTFNIYESLN
nr:MAG TPA: hypothetical protein [Caudoviricetes sp.]